jgi:5'(3')-deoxyribonucleotidase
MRPYTVAVDVDGCVRDWEAGLRRVWSELGGTASAVCDSWALREHFRHPALDVYEVAFRTHPRAVQRLAPAFPGALPALRRLEERGVAVVLVTAQPNFTCRMATTEWLLRHAVPFTGLRYVAGEGDKTVVPAQLYLDDGPHNLERFAAAGRPFIVMDRPYNRSLPALSGQLARSNDWDTIVDLVLAHRAEQELVA